MKRLISILIVALAVGIAASALAAKKSDTEKPEVKASSWKGEIVDMGCYLGHGAKGEKHKACALKCVANGMPMGLLTEKGKLYLITVDHDDADPFNQAKDLAGSMVEITGSLMERDGFSAIDITGIKAASAD
jgi:hypothetical protein